MTGATTSLGPIRRTLAALVPQEELLQVFGWWTGIIKEIFLGAVEEGDPKLFHVSVAHTHLERILDLPFEPNLRAAGSGLTLADALGRAVGEVIERYASYFCDQEAVVLDTYRGLQARGLRALSPERFQPFSAQQHAQAGFPFAPFSEDTPIGWVEGVSLADGKPIHLPAQVVYFAYKRRLGEPPITYATSSGCACASSPAEALYKGICEQVERDAVMCAWYARVHDLPKLVLPDDDPLAETLRDRGFLSGNLEAELRLLPTDLSFSAFLGIGRLNVSGKPRAFVGGAASLDPRAAAFKAFLEVGQGVPFIKSILLQSPAVPAGSTFNNFDDNLRYYAAPENMNKLSFLWSSDRRVELSRIPDQAQELGRDPVKLLARAVKDLVSRGMEPIALDLTPGDVAALGFNVSRVLIPELVQLGTPGTSFLGNPRIWRMPRRLGLDSLPEDRPNPDLHPYP